MTRNALMTGAEAFEILRLAGIFGPDLPDFHTLSSDQVEGLLAEASRWRYRKPKNANGSRGRYFYAYVCRTWRTERRERALSVLPCKVYSGRGKYRKVEWRDTVAA